MDAAGLRPLGIGEALDASIKVYRARFGPLVKATTVVIAPVYILFALAQISAGPSDDASLRSSENSGAFSSGLGLFGMVVFIATQFATAVAVRIVGDSYVGEESDWRRALGAMWSRARSLLWLSLLYGLGLVLAALIAAVGIVTGFLPWLWVLTAIAVGVYLYGTWIVAVPVLMAEGTPGWGALQRSRQLVKGRWWPVTVAVMLAAILVRLLMSAAESLVIGLAGASGNEFVESIAWVSASTAGAALTTPFIAAVVVVVYFDLRVRKEGFDLELLARRVGVAPDESQRSTPLPPPPPSPTSSPDDPNRPPFWPPPPGWRPPDA